MSDALNPGNLKPYRSGDNMSQRMASASDLNRPINAIEAMIAHLQNNLSGPKLPEGRVVEVWIGKTIATPDGATVFTGSTYWVRRQKVLTDTAPEKLGYVNDEDIPGLALVVPALNLSEYVGESHLVPTGEIVLVVGFDGGNGTGKRQYFFVGGSGRGILARITAQGGSFPDFTYTTQRIIGYNSALTGAARWVTDGIDLPSVNGFEQVTGTPPYTHATGVTITDIDGTVNGGDCMIRPIGVGAIVQLYSIPTSAGDALVYIFSAPNSAQA
jgi:hypothetical protein